MATFLRYPHQKTLNLEHVSNFGFLKDKIVFNMDYSVTLKSYKNNNKVIISDYVYWIPNSFEELIEMKALILESTIFSESSKLRWIQCSNDPEFKQRIVNMDCVSSIKFDDERRKVIFNLSHTVTFGTGLTSEFVFYKFRTQEEYTHYKEIIKYI